MPCSINWKFLPLKLFYFNFFAALAVLFPFLPIFFKSVGLSFSQSSIIFGTIPFLGFVSRILLGACADRYRKHKLVVIVCVLANAVVFNLMLFIPFAGFKQETTRLAVSCSTTECRNSSNETCYLSCENESNVSCGAMMNSSSFSCDKNVSCALVCESRVSVMNNFSIFLILLVLSLVGSVFRNAIISIQDTIAYAVLGEKRSEYGKQRLWGTVGFGVFALVCGYLLQISESRNEFKYVPSFVLYLVLSVFSALSAIPYHIENDIRCTNIVGNMFHVVVKPHVLVFMFVVLVCGINFGALESFLFWFLEETLNASKMQFGVCLLLQGVLEVPAWYWGNSIIKRIGYINAFIIVLVAYAIRLTGYSLIQHAWLALVFDAFNCITFGLFYFTAVQYGTVIAPRGMEATMQNLISGTYFGIGRGCGSFIAGAIHGAAGHIVMLRSYALMTLIVSILIVIYNFLSTKPAEGLPKGSRRSPKQMQT